MLKSSQLDLSAIIAIGNLEHDLDNVVEIVKKCYDFGVEIILALDNQPRVLREELELQLTGLKNRNLVLTAGNWGNPGTPRNVGLALASRNYVAFWDSDDMPNIEGVKNSLAELIRTSSDAVLGKFSIRNGNQFRLEPTYMNRHSISSLDQRILSNPGLWRFLFRKDVINLIQFPPFSSAEDQNFLQRFLGTSPIITEGDQNLYTYVQGGKSQLTKSPKVAEETLSVVKLGLGDAPDIKSEFESLRDGLHIKQVSTIMKHGNFRQRLEGFLALLNFGRRVGIRRFATANYKFLYARSRHLANRNFRVRVLLMGGLGNQLFQVSYATYLSTVLGAEVKILDLSRNTRRSKDGLPEVSIYKDLPILEISKPGKFNTLLDRGFGFLIRLHLSSRKSNNLEQKLSTLVLAFLSSIKWKSAMRIFVADNIGWVKWAPKDLNYIAIGYFQSYLYASHPQVLSALRALSSDTDCEEVERFRNLAIEERPLLVHIRLGDYRNEANFGILPASYYHKAICEQMRNYSYGSIWVFSDENPDLNEYIPSEFLGMVKEIKSVGSNSVALLEVMRMCHGYVIANSTLSWWAALLSKNQNPIVLYPEPWFSNLPTPRELISPDWIPVARK